MNPQDKTTDTCNQSQPMSFARMTAKNLILDKIAYMQGRITHLQILHDLLPTQTTEQQDAAMFAIVCSLQLI